MKLLTTYREKSKLLKIKLKILILLKDRQALIGTRSEIFLENLFMKKIRVHSPVHLFFIRTIL